MLFRSPIVARVDVEHGQAPLEDHGDVSDGALSARVGHKVHHVLLTPTVEADLEARSGTVQSVPRQ